MHPAHIYTQVTALQKSVQRGTPADSLLQELRLLGLEVTPFSPEEGRLAGELVLQTQSAGLSLGDWACLATAQALGAVAITADKAWSGLELSVEVRVVR